MTPFVLACSLGMGFVAGLRSLTAPAFVSLAARLGWLDLAGSPLAFMGSTAAVVVFSLLAILEYVSDLLPKTPNRTAPGPLIARIVTGALAGACISLSARSALLAGAFLGGIGGIVGAFAGYHVRRGLVRNFKIKDPLVAIPEDLVAIALAFSLVSKH